MGLTYENQKNIYENYWEIIENLAKNEATNQSLVSDFIRDFLTLEMNIIPNKGKVYLEFKKKYPTKDFENTKSTLLELKNLVQHYNKLINPKNESDIQIRNQLEYIQKLEINVAYPFLLKLYDDYSKKIINKEILINVLELIQSYTWRRFIIGLQTNSLNKIFMNLYKSVDTSNYLKSIELALIKKTGAQRFPNNSELLDALKIKDIYNIQSKNRLYFLNRLENFNNTEKVNIDETSEITIEHIFPQNPDIKWKTDIGTEEYNFIKNNYLHTISNLTLSGNNGALSNKTFIEKRDLPEKGYKSSRLWLNKKLSSFNKWGKNEIEERLKEISDRFLDIWKYPNIEIESIANDSEINVFDIDDATNKKIDYAVFLGNKIEEKHMSRIYTAIISQLFELEPDIISNTDLVKKLNLISIKKEDTLRTPSKINDSYCIETNLNNNEKLERIKFILEILKLEEELFIKFSSQINSSDLN